MTEPARSSLWMRFRVILDTTTSVVVIACTVLVFYWLLSPAKARESADPIRAAIAIPSESHTLQGAAFIGDASASVVMLLFSDFQCPFCEKFATQVLPVLQKEYIDSGRLQIAFRNLPIKIHPQARAAAMAATCAAEQGKFRPLHDLLFANQRSLSDESIKTFVGSVGLDLTEHSRCLESVSFPDR